MTQQDIEVTWNKAREQKETLLNHYNNTIKPTLLDFYNITGEDLNIKIQDKNINIIFEQGDRIQYELIHKIDKTNLYLLNTNPNQYIHTYLDTDEYIKAPNVKVTKVFNTYWSEILDYMNTRIDICLKEYQSLLVNDH